MENDKWKMISLLLRHLSFLPHLLNSGDKYVFKRIRLFASTRDVYARALQLLGNVTNSGPRICVNNDVQAISEQRNTPILHLRFQKVIPSLGRVSHKFDHVA